MAQASRQIQTQTQQQIQTLSPQQILAVKLLELPAVELEDRVRAELLENPALEEGKEATADNDYADDTPDTETESPEDGGDTGYDSLGDYLTEDDIPTTNCRRTTGAATSARKKSRSRTAPRFTKP